MCQLEEPIKSHCTGYFLLLHRTERHKSRFPFCGLILLSVCSYHLITPATAQGPDLWGIQGPSWRFPSTIWLLILPFPLRASQKFP